MVVGSNPSTQKLFDGFSNRRSQIEGLDEYFDSDFFFAVLMYALATASFLDRPFSKVGGRAVQKL